MKDLRSLDGIKVGQSVTVSSVGLEGGIRRRLEDIGLIEGARAECVGISPPGDPIALLIGGTVIAVRKRDCKEITVDYGSDS